MSTDGPRFSLEGIRVVLLGEPPLALTSGVMTQLSRRVRVPCRVEPAPAGLELRPLPQRNQVDADHLLGVLEKLECAEREFLVGLTDRDLGNPIFTYFFGRARRWGRAALVSVARLEPTFYGLPDEPEVTTRRAALEILHEMGHLAGLAHCEDNACLMRFCTDVGAIDNRGTTFCGTCSTTLPGAFDPVALR